jgi:hypothetical protein
MLSDFAVAVIAVAFVASAFLCAFCCDVFRLRRHHQTSYLPNVKKTDARIKIPSGIAE